MVVRIYFLSIVILLGCSNNSSKKNDMTKPLSEAEKTVVNFYHWYLDKVKKGELGMQLHFDSPDSIIQIAPASYLSVLLSSGYIDKEYTKEIEAYLEECNKRLKAEKQTDGVPECIATDLITHEQDQPQGYVTTSVKISGDKATVEAKGFDLTSENDSTYCCAVKVSLLRKGERWLITEIDR